jgi:hypothetical protein
MFCFSCRPIVQLSDEAKQISKCLENLTYFYLGTGLLKLLFGDYNSFLNDIVIILLTVLTFSGANYYIAAILVFMLIFQGFFTICAFALLIQNYYFGLIMISSWIQLIYISVISFSLILSLIILYYSFLAYKEYKALFIEQHHLNAMRNYGEDIYLISSEHSRFRNSNKRKHRDSIQGF